MEEPNEREIEREIRSIFPALERLSIICHTSNSHAFYHDIVTSYQIHLAYNEQFPNHPNQFFQNPFIRYLDQVSWVPGLDGIYAVDRCQEDLPPDTAQYPGVIPVGKEFITKLQRAPLEFEETNWVVPPRLEPRARFPLGNRDRRDTYDYYYGPTEYFDADYDGEVEDFKGSVEYEDTDRAGYKPLEIRYLKMFRGRTKDRQLRASTHHKYTHPVYGHRLDQKYSYETAGQLGVKHFRPQNPEEVALFPEEVAKHDAMIERLEKFGKRLLENFLSYERS